MFRLLLIVVIISIFVAPSTFTNAQTDKEYRSIYVLSWHPDNDLLAIGYNQGDVEVITKDTGELVASLKYEAPIDALSWSNENNQLAIASNHYGIEGRNLSGDILWKINEAFSMRAIAWTPDNSAILVTRYRSTLGFYVWNIESEQIVYSDDIPTATDLTWNSSETQFGIGYLVPYLEIRDQYSFAINTFLGMSKQDILDLLN